MTKMTVTFIGSQAKNIIFLDIDGVLNGYNKWNLLGWKIVSAIKSKRLRLWYTKLTDPFGVHESKVKRLAKIVKATNAKVVMSSSWRFGWWNTPYEKQFEDQKKLTDLLNKYDIEVIDITPRSSDGRRDKEIKEWLTKHKDIVKRFVVLDDERYDLECFVGSHLVQTSSVGKGEIIMGCDREDTGLKRKHVKQAIEILRK
jgi:sugar/nucleoside kinase (ribokinase family)